MNSKFYVSLEVARLLKEKGCPINGRITKAEAIDWLESKGMCIIVFRRTIDNKVGWRYVIHGQTEFISGFSTRLQAEGAAIFKALKLLNRKEE